MTDSPRPWRTLESTITFSDRWLTVRSDRCVTAEGLEVSPYHVIEYPDWVNVVGFTDEGRIVLVREYRHGLGQVMLGLVSGMIETQDGADKDAAALEAARRELEEETGYVAGEMTPFLRCSPNSANHNNRVTSYLAFGLQRSGRIALDPAENIEVVVTDFPTVLADLRDGRLEMHAMHVAALWTAAARIAHGLGPLAQLRDRLKALFA